MAIIPVGFAQVNLVFSGTGLPEGAESTYAVALEGVEQTPTGVATSVGALYVGRILTFQSINLQLESVRVKFGPNDTGGFGESTINEFGDALGESWPPQVALLVEKKTDLGGRRGRGRMYLPNFAEATVDEGGIIDPANVTAINAVLDDWLLDHSTNNLTMYLLHSSGVSTPTVITELSVDPRTATQRRRNRR